MIGYILTLYFGCIGANCTPLGARFPHAYQTVQQCREAGSIWMSLKPESPTKVIAFSCKLGSDTQN